MRIGSSLPVDPQPPARTHDPATCPHCRAGVEHPGRRIGEKQAAAAKAGEAAQAREVAELASQDREVRAHEQAHAAAAGAYLRGGPRYEYVTGPDGNRYAVSGEVSIDTSEIAGDPEATLRKAQVVQAAANAPAEPSSQDRAVAAQAAQMAAKATAELARRRYQESSGEAEAPALDPVLDLVA
jgi:hypothetical protein